MDNDSKDKTLSRKETYDVEINRAKSAGKTQRNDTNPMVEKVGYMGMDDLDRLRRRKIK